jgi:hypothetical protein
MDEAFTDKEMADISGLQAIRDRVVRASGNRNPTVRDFLHFSGRGRVHNPIIGGPKEISDQLEQSFVSSCQNSSIAVYSARSIGGRPCATIYNCPFRRLALGAARPRRRSDRVNNATAAGSFYCCQLGRDRGRVVLIVRSYLKGLRYLRASMLRLIRTSINRKLLASLNSPNSSTRFMSRKPASCRKPPRNSHVNPE